MLTTVPWGARVAYNRSINSDIMTNRDVCTAIGYGGLIFLLRHPPVRQDCTAVCTQLE